MYGIHSYLNTPVSGLNRPTPVVLSREEKSIRYQQQYLGHLFAKTFAFVTNVVAMGMSLFLKDSWEGSSWGRIINHGLYGTLPVHIMAITMLVLATKVSREMSLIHDYMCAAVCTAVAIIMYFVIESESTAAVFLSMTAIMLAFDIAIHTFTENN